MKYKSHSSPMDGWMDELCIKVTTSPSSLFTGVAGNESGVAASLADETPHNFSSAVTNDSIINRMTDQVNIHAAQMRLHGSDITPHSRLHSWQPTTKTGWRICRTPCMNWLGTIPYCSKLLEQKHLV